MRHLFISIAALASSLPAAGFAAELPVPADTTGWFLRTHASIGLSHAAGSFDVPPPGSIDSEQTSYDPQENYGAGIGIGYGWSAWGIPVRAVLDGSLNFRHDTDVEATFPAATATYANDLRIWDVRLSLLADVYQFGWGSIYVGGGVGAALLESDVSIDSTPTRTEHNEWKFSPSVEVGVVLDRAFARVIPELSYRFRWFGDTQSGTFPTGERLNYDNVNIHEVMFGLTMPLSPSPDRGFVEPAPSADEFTWTGFYLGGYGGWGWSNDIAVTELVTPGGVFYNPNNNYNLSPSGFLAGGQIGVDWQWRWLVLGLGAEGGVLDLDDSVADPTSPGGDTVTSLDTGLYGAVTVRAGLAYDRFLLFARAGAAYLDGDAETVDTCTAPPCGPATVTASQDDVFFGWTAGAGVEVALGRHWSVGTEYRYLRFFDSFELGGTAIPGGPVSQTVAQGGIDGVHTVRGQVNFRW